MPCLYNIISSALGNCDDTAVGTAPFSNNAASFPPTVCGTLTGQHSKPMKLIEHFHNDMNLEYDLKVFFPENSSTFVAKKNAHRMTDWTVSPST